MPFLLSISFHFAPLLRAGDREAAPETVCRSLSALPGRLPCPGSGLAALSAAAHACSAAGNTRAVLGGCIGSAERRGWERSGGDAPTGGPVLSRRPPGRCGERSFGSAGGRARERLRSGARAAASASPVCARPSRGAGRQSAPRSAGGCARHRPRLRFRFFPACPGPRRWAAPRSPGPGRAATGPASHLCPDR